MNRHIKVLQTRHQEAGSVLVTILVIAIIIVLVLMWQAGIFSSADEASPVVNTVETDPLVSESETAPPSEPAGPKLYERAPDGKDAASIQAAIDSLVAAHPVDLSACRSIADAIEALQCAASKQTTVLQAAFEDYNARRAAGDLATNARGGEVLKGYVASLKNNLKPFEDAVK